MGRRKWRGRNREWEKEQEVCVMEIVVEESVEEGEGDREVKGVRGGGRKEGRKGEETGGAGRGEKREGNEEEVERKGKRKWRERRMERKGRK